jgi:hypothetical protein
MRWCRESRGEFVENVVWRIKMHPPGLSVIEFYGMRDGTVVEFGQLYYTPDSWCVEHSSLERALERIIDYAASSKVAYVSGDVSGEVPKELAGKISSIVRTPLPADP